MRAYESPRKSPQRIKLLVLVITALPLPSMTHRRISYFGNMSQVLLASAGLSTSCRFSLERLRPHGMFSTPWVRIPRSKVAKETSRVPGGIYI